MEKERKYRSENEYPGLAFHDREESRDRFGEKKENRFFFRFHRSKQPFTGRYDPKRRSFPGRAFDPGFRQKSPKKARIQTSFDLPGNSYPEIRRRNGF